MRRAILPALPILLAALPAAVSPARGQDPAEFVARGDRRMAAFETEAAIDAYRAGLDRHPTDVTLLWKASRALTNRAIETPGEEGDEARYEEAVALARRAVRHGPEVARAHASLAAALGRLALFRGGRRKVELAREVHAGAREAIALDPSDFAGFVVLGVWHREVATLNPILKVVAGAFLGGLPDASLERSRVLLDRAVALAPETIAPRLERARTLVEMDEEAAAAADLREALALPPREALDRVQKRWAEALLEEIGG